MSVFSAPSTAWPWPDLAGGLQVGSAAVSAFVATNLDDILLLLVLFSASTGSRHRWSVVAGQYLGFSLLVAASLLGFVGGQLLPSSWIGLLGLLPISLGVSQLVDSLAEAPGDAEPPSTPAVPPWLSGSLLPFGQVLAVAGITVANGGDNVGVYLPLFARSGAAEVVLTLVVFAVMVAVWCGLAWALVQTPALAELIQRYGQPLVPLVLIGLGVLILIDSHALANRSLAVLVLIGLMALSLGLWRQLSQSLQLLAKPALPSRSPSSP